MSKEERRGEHEKRNVQDVYADWMAMSHREDSIILNFGKGIPKLNVDEKGNVKSARGELDLHTRVWISPTFAKKLLINLKQTVEAYEEKFGRISISEEVLKTEAKIDEQ